MSEPSNNNIAELDAVVAQANQIANTILLALRTVHEYIVPRAASHGIKLSAREQHAWAVSLSIALSQSKAYHRMPTTRQQPSVVKPPKKKPALFEHAQEPADSLPFSDPTIAPALRRLRQLLERHAITEAELLGIVRESAPRQTLFVNSLQDIPDRTAELCLERWPTIVELIEAGRRDGGEAA